MGNWSSTNKSTTVNTVDASAFNEEKAPTGNRSAVAASYNQVTVAETAAAPLVNSPKPKVNPANNGGMRSLNALEAPLK